MPPMVNQQRPGQHAPGREPPPLKRQSLHPRLDKQFLPCPGITPAQGRALTTKPEKSRICRRFQPSRLNDFFQFQHLRPECCVLAFQSPGSGVVNPPEVHRLTIRPVSSPFRFPEHRQHHGPWRVPRPGVPLHRGCAKPKVLRHLPHRRRHIGQHHRKWRQSCLFGCSEHAGNLRSSPIHNPTRNLVMPTLNVRSLLSIS